MQYKNKFLFFLLALSVLFSSCKTEKIDTPNAFDLPTGGYMRTVTPWPLSLTFSKAAISTAEHKLTLEAYDAQEGKLFASYDLTIRFVDRTPTNGNKSVAYKTFKSLPASSFSPDATTKLPRSVLTLNATEMLTVLGVQAADISATDWIEIGATMKLSNGMTYTASNSSADITGGAYYRSPFFYRVAVVQ